MTKYTPDNVFDGIAVMELITGNRERLDVVFDGIAKMRGCPPSDVHDKATCHVKHLKGLTASLVAHADILDIMGQTPSESQAARIAALQAPAQASYLKYCLEQLALTEGQAREMMQRMVTKNDG